MIKSFRHKGLEAFYRKGSRAGINPQHTKRLQAQLTALDVANQQMTWRSRVGVYIPWDMILPGTGPLL